MRFLWFLILVPMFAGCQSKQPPSSKSADSAKQEISTNKPADGSQAAPESNILKGKVLERIDADRYSYLRLSTASGEIWAAVLQSEVKAGDEVSVVSPIPMDGFESKTLKRKFDKIVFGMLDQQTQKNNEMQTLSKAHAGVSNTSDAGPIKVQKAAGAEGRTVAEIFAQKLQLKDKKVAVRGKVVKVNANIMGNTWIHLRDGSGKPESKTDDLTITTKGSAAVGDTILVEGTVRTDKNLGMGYVFSVVVEDAAVTKQ
jgi:hypothetical protein